MLLYQINIIAQQFFQVLCRSNVVHQLWRHGHEQVHIAPFMMFVSGHRAEQQHGSDAETRPQLIGMRLDNIHIFLSCPHVRFHLFLQMYDLFLMFQVFG